ncbi:MAG: hypothetical protein IT443_00850 [Phycisphaeraceae bacterium]|nr:hypothetical protein [Phycisphaeraceae bacterium]
MRFELIDRVLERQPDRLVAVKSVTAAEEYLADHFPGFPVLPGVMMLEALVQAGRLLAEGQDEQAVSGRKGSSHRWVLTEAKNVRYGNMVRPGQSLWIEVTVRNRQADQLELAGLGKVEDQVAVQGRFTLCALANEPAGQDV